MLTIRNPYQRCLLRHPILVVVSILTGQSVNPFTAAADERQVNRLPAGLCTLEVSEDGRQIFTGGLRENSACVIDVSSKRMRRIPFDGKGIAALHRLPDEDSLLAATVEPPALISLQLNESTNENTIRLPLPGQPFRIAVSEIGVACVTMTWEHSVALASIDELGKLSPILPRVIPLSFPPGHVVAVSKNRFLIADAFGGRVALLDLNSETLLCERDLPVHHISGLCATDSGTSIRLSHQRLSSVAETSRDDIHWGALIQNLVSTMSIDAFVDSKIPDKRMLQSQRLGDVGNGASDPAGLAISEAQELYVAISGTDQLAVFRRKSATPEFLDVGTRPTEVRPLGEGRAVVMNRGSETLSFIRTSQPMEVEATIGEPFSVDTPEARGERAFFSAKLAHDQWMSCNSCHVDGHSPDLLADTLGDGRHESPKRIPTLLGVSETGPWAWIGNKSSLEDQIQQTLDSTMHGDEHHRAALGTSDTITRDLLAYLSTLQDPPAPHATIQNHSNGQTLFDERGCRKCHDPNNAWTSRSSWDIGVHDEQGHHEFNPPSLRGVAHRRAFFHDARFGNLDDLLQSHHPGHELPPESDQRHALMDFLHGL